jgi:hypothetical protein
LHSGEGVVVKVQRPGLKQLFDIDLNNLRILAEQLDKGDENRDFKVGTRPLSGAQRWHRSTTVQVAVTGKPLPAWSCERRGRQSARGRSVLLCRRVVLVVVVCLKQLLDRDNLCMLVDG